MPNKRQEPITVSRSIQIPSNAKIVSRKQTIAFARSWSDEPTWMLPDLPDIVINDLSSAIVEAKEALQPGNPAEILGCLNLLANRLNLDLPEENALAFDIDIMASWPRDLFKTAFLRIWETYTWRRMPTVGDFHKIIEANLQERRQVLSRLEDLSRKIKTNRLRQKWNERARININGR